MMMMHVVLSSVGRGGHLIALRIEHKLSHRMVMIVVTVAVSAMAVVSTVSMLVAGCSEEKHEKSTLNRYLYHNLDIPTLE